MGGTSRVVLAALLAGVALAVMAPTASASVRACHGVRATIVGGPGNNHIRGTTHRDVIAAGRGRDIVLGRGGNDLICGGRGNDQLDGGKGLDTDYAGYGRDVCFAPTHREHMRHHNCEVHLGAPRGRGPRAAAALPRLGATANAAIQECSADVCFAGVPVCGKDANGTPSVAMNAPWPFGVAGISPIGASLYQGGKIAVSLEVDAFNEFNQQEDAYGPGPVTTYSNLNQNTTYFVPPNPSHIPDPASSSGAEVVYVYFNEFNPATGQWQGWFWAQATNYKDPPIDSSLAGQCLNVGGF